MISKFPSILSTALGASLLLSAAHAQDRGPKKRPLAELDVSKLPPASHQTAVTFDKDIRPLFEKSCFRCHGEEKQKGDVRLDSLEATMKGGKAGKIVVPGDSAKSRVVVAVGQIDDAWAMPPKRGGGGPGGPRGFGRPPGAGGPGAVEGQPPAGAGATSGAPNPPTAAEGTSFPPRSGNAPGGTSGPGGPGGPGGPASKALTPAEVGLVRAWIDQGAK